MTTPYKVQLSVILRPIWHDEYPLINIGVDGNLKTVELKEVTTFDFDYTATEHSELVIEFLNKTDRDVILADNLDKAVLIEKISFFGITDPKFVWAGIYTPIYPPEWVSEQKASGAEVLDNLTSVTYLGWNGRWVLRFDVPVFTWIHKIQHLGWIHS